MCVQVQPKCCCVHVDIYYYIIRDVTSFDYKVVVLG